MVQEESYDSGLTRQVHLDHPGLVRLRFDKGRELERRDCVQRAAPVQGPPRLRLLARPFGLHRVASSARGHDLGDRRS